MRKTAVASSVVVLMMLLIAGKPGAQQIPPSPAPVAGPQIGGGRGENPMPGLAALVESPTTGPNAPRFEVASVKRNAAGVGPGANTSGRTLPGGRVQNTNVPLMMMIRNAYGLKLTEEAVGGPDWINTYGFDVDAKPEGSVTIAQSRLMLRTLLAERFKLVVRKEPREGPIYALVLSRRDGTLGRDIKRPSGACVMTIPAGVARAAGADPNAPNTKPGPWPKPGQPGRRCGVGPDGINALKAGSVTMATLVTVLTPLVDRPVVDKTGLTGDFDFDLSFDGTMVAIGPLGRGARGGAAAAVSPDTPSDPSKLPSIFTALQEQLGLKLDSQRGSVDVLAIKSVELPSEN